MANKRKINTNKFVRINYDDIVKDDNLILREVSKDVVWPLSKEDHLLMNQMIDYVRSSQDENEIKTRKLRSAYGISAVQLGHLKKMIYVRIENKQGFDAEEFALINPQIISQSSSKITLKSGEGCLSVERKIEGYVFRSNMVKILAIDHFTDREIEIEAHGLTAIVLQHEMDHLMGIMFYDRIDKLNPYKIDSLINKI